MKVDKCEPLQVVFSCDTKECSMYVMTVSRCMSFKRVREMYEKSSGAGCFWSEKEFGGVLYAHPLDDGQLQAVYPFSSIPVSAEY